MSNTNLKTKVEWAVTFPDRTEVALTAENDGIKTRRDAERFGLKHGAIEVARVEYNDDIDYEKITCYKLKPRRKALPAETAHAVCNVCGEELHLPTHLEDNGAKAAAFDFQFTHGIEHGSDNCVETWQTERLTPDVKRPLQRMVPIGHGLFVSVLMNAPDPPELAVPQDDSE